MKFLKTLFPIFIIIILSYFAIAPFLKTGFFPMHDDTQVARVFEMTKSLKSGMFPVRWVFDLGYGLGYPIFNFYAPLSYYFGAIFMLVGFNALLATKITMILGIILAGIFMYLFTKELFGKTGGIVSALFYIYAPYHALDIYVRGDVAEFWAYAFIPLVFFGLWKISKKGNWNFILITALGMAGITLSHNLTAMMASPFIILYTLILSIFLIRNREYKKIYYMILSLILGVAISAFYWFPALLEMKNTNVLSQIGGGSHFPDHFACIAQLWSSPWGFGGSTKGCVDGLSFMIGKAHILLSFLSFILITVLIFWKKIKLNDEKVVIGLFAFLGFIFSAFLTIDASLFIWKDISLMAFFQFPWRFLLMVSFFSSILSGAIIWQIGFINLKKLFPHLKLEIAGLLIVGLLFLNIKFFIAQKQTNVDSNYYTNEYALKWRTSKISDEYLPKNTIKPKNASQALLSKREFSFKETPVERASDLISLVGILALFIGIIYPRLRHE